MSMVNAEFDFRGVPPFVKWAGGKGQLLRKEEDELNKMIPH